MNQKVINVQIGEKSYRLEYTRRSISKTEQEFGFSMLKRDEPKTATELIDFLKALLYGALIKHQPSITPQMMDNIYDEFISDEGFEQEGLVEGLVELMGNVLNPMGGGRRTSLFLETK